jgi:hypothetical protein
VTLLVGLHTIYAGIADAQRSPDANGRVGTEVVESENDPSRELQHLPKIQGDSKLKALLANGLVAFLHAPSQDHCASGGQCIPALLATHAIGGSN